MAANRPKWLRCLEVLEAGYELTIDYPPGMTLRVQLSVENQFCMVATREEPGKPPEDELLVLDWPLHHIVRDLDKIPDDVLIPLEAGMVLTKFKQSKR